MPSTALDGASKYLNNLLLARGFLHDGEPIDFSLLAGTEDDKDTKSAADGSNTAVYTNTTRVINLVHDLVLRRDRDAEQREALAATIRTLRAEEAQRLLDFQRLQDKNAQLKSELSTAEAQQRSSLASAKKAQAETRELKEQALKLKSTLDQVRAKCISDVRKRDVELEKLKSHLGSMNRGKKESSAGGMKINSLNIQQKSTAGQSCGPQDVNNSEWTLENETNDFLAAVVNETSSENVSLRKIVEDSMDFLRSLTGLDEQEQERAQQQSLTDPSRAIGIPGQYRDRSAQDHSHSQSLVPVQSLASSMSEVLGHCQTLLRDPSFVPIEEVQIRDEEIEKLRVGWEEMADRWKEAVTMMSQWKQKMLLDTEHSHVSIEEAQTHFDAGGLSGIQAFGRSVAMRPNGLPVLDPIEEEELTSMLMDHHSKLGDRSALSTTEEQQTKDSRILHDETLPEPDETGTPRQAPISIHHDMGSESDLDLSEKITVKPMASPARRGVKLSKPERQPLSDSNANSKKRKSDTAASSPRKRRSISPEPRASSPNPHKGRTIASAALVNASNLSVESTDPLQLDTLTSDISADEAEDEEDLFTAEPAIKSKIPRMTVAQKLAAVQAEASEATEVIRRRQATTRSDDRSRRASGVEKAKTKTKPAVGTTRTEEKKRQPAGMPKGHERVKKARDRRRSTLTPAELGTLMGR